MKLLKAIGISTLFPLTWFGPSVHSADYLDQDSKTKYFLETEPTPDLQVLMKDWTSLESALASLPKTMRMNYVLMHTSGSIQESSFVYPRVLLFSPTADLVISFNGHDRMIGGQRLEALAFNKQSESYDFVEVDFSGKKPKLQINPNRCLSCHTDYRLPNWRPYANWNGAYGGLGNGFANTQFFVEDSPFPGYSSWRPDYAPGDKEFEVFKKFLAQQKLHSRYGLLLQPKDQSFWPFAPTMPFLETDPFDFSPNRRLGIGLAFHQARFISSRLKQKQLFKAYPANLIALLIGCSADSTRPFRERILTSFEEQPLYSKASDLQEDKRNSSYTVDSSELYQLLAITGLRPEIWMMDLTQRTNRRLTYMNYPAIGGLEMDQIQLMVGTKLLVEYLKSNPNIRVKAEGPSDKMANRMIAPISFLQKLNKIIPLFSKDQIKQQVCPQLELKMSQEIQTQLRISPELTPDDWQKVKSSQEGKPYALRQCAACHVERSYGPKAPYIPFDNGKALARALKKQNGKLLTEIRSRTRLDAQVGYGMPYGPISLHPTIRQELIDYLEKLQAISNRNH